MSKEQSFFCYFLNYLSKKYLICIFVFTRNGLVVSFPAKPFSEGFHSYNGSRERNTLAHLSVSKNQHKSSKGQQFAMHTALSAASIPTLSLQ